MEYQFSQNTFSYLKRAVWEVKNEEQTQEVKLSDGMPDIGKILGVWGQPLIRSKEWRGSSMSASGGMMVWILYTPEEGEPQCVETWMPFQMQWDFPQSQHDGTMRLDCLLKGIDARCVSARKMMVRTLLSVMGEALEPTQTELYQPAELPEDIQLRKESYPLRIPTEAGEKIITLDEEVTPKFEIRKIVHCSLHPEVLDQKIMADKLVFRGNAKIQALCLCEEGKLEAWEFEIPFSQYTELEKEYDPRTYSDMIPAVTNLELEIQENGTVRLKVGLVGQYVIYERPVLELVTDAYSNQRSVSMEQQTLDLPMVSDICQEIMRIELPLEQSMNPLLDATTFLGHPSFGHISGSFQLLGVDAQDTLCGSNLRWEKELETGTRMVRATVKGKTSTSSGSIHGEILLDMQSTALTSIPMVTSLEMGENIQKDTDRPSLILRRVGSDSLWEMAKACGSTVHAILEANGLTDEPEKDQMLLIPVL